MPKKVESPFINHPAIKEVRILANLNEVKGETMKAFIVIPKNYVLSQDFVKKETVLYKYPRKIEFVDEIPKTINGKIRRKQLKEFGNRLK